MSELVSFEELGHLQNADLRAVFEQMAEREVLDALDGVAPDLRGRLLSKLAPARATRWEADLRGRGPASTEATASAQKAVIEVLCRLSRSGQVAFDDPEDMVA